MYPSPAGPVRSHPDHSWAVLVQRHQILQEVNAGVEALLMNATAPPGEIYIAPIDRCYQLVGLVRVCWRDLSGGPQIPGEVGQFFAALRESASGAEVTGPGAGVP